MTNRTSNEPTDRELEIALYGDGRCVTHWGQDGDPQNGERLFNTKEDDARADAECEIIRKQDHADYLASLDL